MTQLKADLRDRLTIGDVQIEVGRLGLGRVNLVVDNSVLGELIITHRKPHWNELRMKKNLLQFKTWIKENKPKNLTVRYVDFPG